MGFASCRYDEKKIAEKLSARCGVTISQNDVHAAMKESQVGGYARVWEIKESPNGKFVDARITTSKKNDSGEYETTFGNYVRFVGSANEQIRKLSADNGSIPIQIIRSDDTNKYDKEKNTTYYNFAVFDFDVMNANGNVKQKPAKAPKSAEPEPDLDDEIDDLPF